MKIIKIFTEHPKEVGENYFTHAIAALSISCRCQIAAYTQFLHAVFPFIAPTPGTDLRSLIKYLENKLPENRKKDNCG
jgi:hypothetical protein